MYNYKYEKHLQNVERCRDGVPKSTETRYREARHAGHAKTTQVTPSLYIIFYSHYPSVGYDMRLLVTGWH